MIINSVPPVKPENQALLSEIVSIMIKDVKAQDQVDMFNSKGKKVKLQGKYKAAVHIVQMLEKRGTL